MQAIVRLFADETFTINNLPSYVMEILRERYLLKDRDGTVTETPEGMLRRVSKTVAASDLIYSKSADVGKTEKEFYEVMRKLEFLPSSPVLFNSGTVVEQLASCFVLPIEDSVESVFDSLKSAALIHKTGAGTGFSFSHLRQKGEIVESSNGVSSGPLSFLRIFDLATEVMAGGGRRRGANMGVMRIDHPDIYDFIMAKSEETLLRNFNLSVSATKEFMNTLKRDGFFPLRCPGSLEVVKRVRAKAIFNLIAASAWRNGEPGLIFIDQVNAGNPTPSAGQIEATNPCGEQPLLPYESCVLGSVNLSKIPLDGKVNWKRLSEIVRTSVHFLDNAIDATKYPLKRIGETTRSNRKIGLGVMGFADLLIELGIPYNSAQGIRMAERIMFFISSVARQTSIELGKERGSFPNFKNSVYPSKGYTQLRNASLTTIAPTGSISLIAGCSSGIEPIFAMIICRKIMGKMRIVGLHPLFKKVAEDSSLDSKKIRDEVAEHGSVQGLSIIPERIRRVFVTALDISPYYHIRMQAAFQKYTDNAVSKTVNMPFSSTIDDVKDAFLLAHRLGCKGITVYRNESRNEQILYHRTPIQICEETVQPERGRCSCSSASCC